MLTRRLALTLGGFVLPTAASLVAVPIVFNSLGPDGLGQLSLFYALVTALAILEGGVARSVAFRVGGAIAEHRDGYDLRDLLVCTVALGVLGIAIGGGAAWLAATLGASALYSALICVAGFTVPGTLINAFTVSALQGVGRFGLAAGVSSTTATISLVVPPVSIALGQTHIPTICIAIAVTRAIVTLAIFLLCTTIFSIGNATESPALRRYWDTMRTLFAIGVSSIASPAANSLDRVVLSIRHGVSEVAFYATSFNIVYRVKILPQSLIQVLAPGLASQSKEQFFRLFDRLAWPSSIVYAVVLSLFPPFFKVWMGDEFADRAIPICSMLMIGLYFQIPTSLLGAWLQSVGRTGSVLVVSMGTLILFSVSAWLVGALGAIAVASAWSARLVVESVLLARIAGGTSELGGYALRGVPLFVMMTALEIFGALGGAGTALALVILLAPKAIAALRQPRAL